MYLPDGLEHARHAAHEANLILDDFASMALGSRFFFFFLLVHLLFKDRGHFDFLGFAAGQLLSTTLLHKVLHHVANLLHKEGN